MNLSVLLLTTLSAIALGSPSRISSDTHRENPNLDTSLSPAYAAQLAVPHKSVTRKQHHQDVTEESHMSQRLSESDIQSRMRDIPTWDLVDNTLQSRRQFKDFIEAINFVNRLVEPAEAAGHHPDIAISYNKVTITLTTHDAGGLTAQDFEMAAVISGIH